MWRHRGTRAGGASRLALAVSSLSVPAYRRFFWSQLVSQGGNAMQNIAQAWLVLEISHSGTALGAVTAVQFVPLLVLGPFGGVIADRWERRAVLLVTQSLLGAVAFAFALVTWLGHPALWVVFILAGATGVTTAFDNPAKQSIVSDLVPVDQLRNAVTLNSIGLNVARVAGPGIGGLLIAFAGVAVCFGVNALSFVGVLWALFTITAEHRAVDDPDDTTGGGVIEGLRYARRSPQLYLPLLMVAFIGMFAWEFPVTLPLLVAQNFNSDPRAYGVMVATMGLGAVGGGILTASRGSDRFPNLPLACAAWGVPLLLVAVAPNFVTVLIVLLFVGYASINFNALSKSTLQLAARPSMRGRIMALWAVAWQGSTPVGGPVVGWIGESASAQWALATGGFAALLAAALTVGPWRRVRRLGLIELPARTIAAAPPAADA